MRKVLKISVVMMVCLNFAVSVYANPIEIEHKGVVGTKYTITQDSSKMMISRDGNKAIPIKKGTVLEKPGIYFLAMRDNSEVLDLQVFEISQNKKPVSVISKQEDLEELFKRALESGQKKLTFSAHADLIEQKVLTGTLEQLVADYPVVFKPSGWEASYTTLKQQKPYRESLPKVELTLNYTALFLPKEKSYKHIIKDQATSILEKTITSDMTELEREHAILEYLTKHIEYSKDKQEDTYPPVTHTIYGALLNKEAVCDGYAETFMYLMNAVGVPTQTIVGTATDIRGSGPHAWNIVCIEGKNYQTDPTWADKGLTIDAQYVNQTDAKMSITHKWDEDLYPVCNVKPPKNNLFSLEGSDINNLLYSGMSLLIGLWMIISVIKRMMHRDDDANEDDEV